MWSYELVVLELVVAQEDQIDLPVLHEPVILELIVAQDNQYDFL